jgi:hypothetical protein
MRWYSSQVEGWRVGRLSRVLAVVTGEDWYEHTDDLRRHIVVCLD